MSNTELEVIGLEEGSELRVFAREINAVGTGNEVGQVQGSSNRGLPTKVKLYGLTAGSYELVFILIDWDRTSHIQMTIFVGGQMQPVSVETPSQGRPPVMVTRETIHV